MGKRLDAALELIRARDNLRLLQRAGMATNSDTEHVKAAEEAYLRASKPDER